MNISVKEVAAMVDHTNLKAYAVRTDFQKLCDEAVAYGFKSVAINTYPVAMCRQMLQGSRVLTGAAVGFPLGQNTTAVKVAETRDAYELGCEEFDMVINVGRLKDGCLDYVRGEIKAVVEAAQGRLVKVIIETGLLTDEEKAIATRLACEAGADFVKTCTGVSQGVATVEDINLFKDMNRY